MSALVLSVSKKEMTEKDKKCLHFTCGHGVLEGAVLIKDASPVGEEEPEGSQHPLVLPSLPGSLHAFSRPTVKSSSGIKWETGLFPFLIIFCFFNAYDLIKKNTQIVGK